MAEGHLSVVPPYVEPRRRSLPVDFTTAVRWICFLIFLASFLLAIPVQNPGSRTVPDLVADIQAGRASSISLKTGSGGQTGPENFTVRWKTNPFTWYEASQTFASQDQLTGLLRTAGDQSGHTVSFGTYTKHRVVFFNLADAGIWSPLSVIAGFLWLATFLGMLATRDHPYATRWAWFWLFVFGGVGPLLILWKEPVPLRLRFWQRNDDHRWTERPISGGTGFVYAIGWTILIYLAGAASRWLATP